jgi:hypothetical protein
LKEKRKQENERRRFAAAIKGIDLGGEEDDTKKKIEEVTKRANERMYGADEVERQEFADLGIAIETA